MSSLGKTDPDSVAYVLEFDDDKTKVRLTLISGESIDAELFLQALAVYVEDHVDDLKSVFEEGIPMEDWGEH